MRTSLTADVLVDILNALASSEVLSDLVPRDMNVVFVSPDFNNQNSELLNGTLQVKIPIFADKCEALETFRDGYLVRSTGMQEMLIPMGDVHM